MSFDVSPRGAVVRTNRGLITISLMLAALIQTLDSTIAIVALPRMQGSLAASQGEITWVLTSYIVAAAIATPLTGWLSDQLGVKRLLALSIGGFTIASVFCGLSDTLTQIVASRLLQGTFGAALVPMSQSIMLSIYPREKRGHAMAVWSMGVVVGPILGPTLGGWLTDSYDWSWVFFINLPIGALALLGVLWFLPGSSPKRAVKFDAFGFATLSLAIGALQAMLDRGEQLDWFGSIEIRIEALLAAISFAFFLAHTATAEAKSFFRYEVLKDRNFAVGVCFVFVMGAVMYATRALLPPMLQSLMNYPVVTAGLVTAPSGVGTMLAAMLAGRLLQKRIDVRLLLLVGFLISAFALWQMMQYTIVLSASDIVWPGVIQGFGLGLVFVPLSTQSFSTLSSELRADGAATYSLMRNIGSSIGISIVETLITRNTQIAHADLVANVNVFNPAIQAMQLSNDSIGTLNQAITRQASMIAYLNDFKLMFVATLMIIPLVLLMRPASMSQDDTRTHAAME